VALTVVDHPLAATMLTALRDATTPPPLFRLLAKRLSLTLVVEATRTVPTIERKVRTPLAQTTGRHFSVPLVTVPILRAGLAMLESVTELFPEVAVGYIGLERDHATFQPSAYYTKLPPLAGAYVLLLDPMLATGGTALCAIGLLVEAGVPEERIVFINFLSSPEGIRAVHERYPRVRIVTSSIEERLNENAYMLPGIGDFGDRYFGTDVPR